MNEFFAKYRLLLADDDPVFRTMLGKYLTSQGYEVILAEDGSQAVELVQQQQFDLVLLDGDMPVIDGLTACGMITQNNKTIPVVIITSSDDHLFIDEAFSFGASDYILKPVHRVLLLQRIRYLVRMAHETKELQQRETAFRKLFVQSPIASLMINHDGMIQQVNLAFGELMGQTANALCQCSFLSLIDEGSQAAAEQALLALRAQRRLSSVLLTLRRGDEQLVVVELNANAVFDQSGNYQYAQATLVNVTDRVRREEELLRLGEALDQVGNSILITDLKGSIQYVNKEFCRVTGYSRRETLGKNPSLLQSGKQDKVFYARMWNALLGSGEWSGVVENRRKNGEHYMERLHIRAFYNREGVHTNYVGVFEDITEQLEAESRYRQAQKMAALGTLVGGVAHNFNNMLAGIVGKCYLSKMFCKAERVDVPRVAQELDGIESIAMQAGDMIHQLLAFVRQGVEHKESTCLNDMVKGAVGIARIGVDADIRIHSELCDDRIFAVIDSAQFQQVVINLINNARDAVRGQALKQITVRLDYVGSDSLGNDFAERLHGEPCAEAYASLQVRDSGCGMDEAIVYQIFDPFFTTKEVGEGTGLGLSMAKGVVEAHHGVIDVESVKDEGTTFTIRLPLSELPQSLSPEPVDDDDSALLPVANSTTILLVDDDDMIRAMAAKLLESLGLTVLDAADGSAALDVFHQHADDIRLVITDVMMPEMNGCELAEAIRRENGDMPIIFITGYDRSMVSITPEDEHHTRMVSKPFDIPEFFRTIKSLI